MEGRGTHAESVPAEGQRTMGGALPELANLMDMVRVMMEDRERHKRDRRRKATPLLREPERRELEREEERRHSDLQREEIERQIVKMHRQMEQLQQMFTEQSVAVSGQRRVATESIKLT